MVHVRPHDVNFEHGHLFPAIALLFFLQSMSFSPLRPTYSYFSGLPPVSGSARSPYAAIQLDVEIPEHIPTSFVEVYVYYQQPFEIGGKDWRKLPCENIGKYKDSRTTHLYAAIIKNDNVARWFATMRLDKDSQWITSGTKDSPYCVDHNLQSVYAPSYFTIGFASLSNESHSSTISTVYANRTKVNIMVNGAKFGVTNFSNSENNVSGRSEESSLDLPFRCFCRYTLDGWKTYSDVEMMSFHHNIKRATLATDPERSVHPSDNLLLFETTLPISEKDRMALECCFFCARKHDISSDYNPKEGRDRAITDTNSPMASWDNNYGFNYSLGRGGSGIGKLRTLWPRLE